MKSIPNHLALWRHFAELASIPRPSGGEARAREWAERVAAGAGAATRTDAFGNLVVQVPASAGRESAAPVCIQAHLDMVCEKRPEVEHNFETDPLRLQVQGEWLTATGTTLGSDNGIGAVMALACLTDPAVVHGPLDLLFTVQEETGLHGAAALDPALLRSRLLINLDTEDPDELVVGCAGGAGATLRLPRAPEPAEGWAAFRLTVSGLRGGHSGLEIHKPLANAIKLLVHCLDAARKEAIPVRLGRVHGGNAHNAIPRDAWAEVLVPADCAGRLQELLKWVAEELDELWRRSEPGLNLEYRPTSPEPALTEEASARLVELLRKLPHGVLRMSSVFPGKVETSSNLATVRTGESAIEITTSTRSFVNAEITDTQERIADLGRAGGAEVELRPGYPGWEPVLGSELQRRTETLYNQLFQREPRVEVVHAGLECGVIAARVPGMEAISFGPRIEGAHTPEERVHIGSVEESWRLLCALLDELSRA